MTNQIIILLVLLNMYPIFANHLFDFRFPSYNESSQSIQVYQNVDESFDAILLDQQRNQIIIGAKNVIIRLSLDRFHLLERFLWESTTNERNICHDQIQRLNECENYIRVIALRSTDQSLLTCGTNAYHPICLWRRFDSLSSIISMESGDGKCPYNSQSPSVYDLLDTGELYSATSNEPIFGMKDPLIQKSFSRGKQLRTQQHDSNWLKNPYFVRILDIGRYIYTFFREISLEHLSCGTNIYSRVARVCKYDDGTIKFSDTFRSYSKLRLSCSRKLSGDIASFDFNELQSIYFDSSSNFVYAAFNLPKSGLVGSAICIYTVEQLENLFKSSFLTQKSNETYWLPSSTRQETEKCEPNLSNDVSSYSSGPVLRSGVLQSSFDALVLDDIRIGHLLIDQLNDISILFIITLDGLWLRKYSLLTNEKDRQLCFIEQIQLRPPMISADKWKVNRAEFIAQTKDIIITTSVSVLKIPAARCQRFPTNDLCLASMDPYCTWNDHYQQCTFSIDLSAKLTRQPFVCPDVNRTMDGDWTTWSPWFTCEQETTEKCQCRTRSCTRANTQLCQGNHIEIRQCEVHGSWSPWSSWSVCPQTCGTTFQSRTRSCTNPQPKNNGRLCIGSEREEEPCSEILCSNQTSTLSAWTEWSSCSKSCDGGIQKRSRTCFRNHEQCQQCLDELRLCNEAPCPSQQVTIWSNWTKMRSDENDTIAETRIRFTCTLPSLEIKSEKTMYRMCDRNGKDCQETDSLDHWSPWSDWSECHPSCDIIGSKQIRRRTCLNNRCLGQNIENRSCSPCSISMQSNWSCWTDWSDCSLCTSSKQHSRKFRTRLCLTNTCEGSSREEQSCSCSSHEYRFTLIHLILIGLVSFLFGCLLILCLYTLCSHRARYREKFIPQVEQDYFQGSPSNSSSSPHTAIDSDIFTTLSKTTQSSNQFRNFDTSSISTSNGNTYLKEIPSRKLNIYINPRDISTLKRTSLMSSMKTNLDADDL